MEALSAVIITYNEERILEKCLQALTGIVDEIVILDSGSTDNTLKIAHKYNCLVHQQTFAGFGKQKNDVIALANNDWVLALDADEIVSDVLREELIELKNQGFGTRKAYSFPLLNNYLGRFIRHGGWYPDHKPRLFNRQYGAWSAVDIHESWQFSDPNMEFGRLNGDLWHFTIADFTHHMQKIEKYTTLSAKRANQLGKKCSWLKLVLAPKWFFVNRYILRLGFLDGYCGYVFCKMASFEKWLKYAKIRNLQQIHNKTQLS